MIALTRGKKWGMPVCHPTASAIFSILRLTRAGEDPFLRAMVLRLLRQHTPAGPRHLQCHRTRRPPRRGDSLPLSTGLRIHTGAAYTVAGLGLPPPISTPIEEGHPFWGTALRYSIRRQVLTLSFSNEVWRTPPDRRDRSPAAASYQVRERTPPVVRSPLPNEA